MARKGKTDYFCICDMKRFGIIAVFTLIAISVVSAQIKTGIEVLVGNDFDILKGKRVGLITNPTGIDSHFKATVDILADAPGVELAALFAPEHGIRGDIPAGAKVAPSTDPRTGITVYSVYGSVKKPTQQMLKGLDALVYDIQDNGCRSYTFISTMGLAMEAAAEAGIEFVVLDRPNPLGGDRVEGPITDPDCISFVSQYPIPYLYGLTPGELARYLKGEGLIKGADNLKLTVVPMDGWHRHFTFDNTGLPWVLTSPHIPSAETCLYYPASGILGELDFLSIGVGYTLPFRTFAAPWINARELADNLNARGLEGIEFRPIHYTPFYGKFKGQNIHGVEIHVTDSSKASLTLPQFYVIEELHRLYPSHNPFAVTESSAARFRMFDNVTGSKETRRILSHTHSVDSLLPLWNRDAEKFRKIKRPYHLYE